MKYGFLGSKSDMEELMKPVINYVDGAQDAPFPPDRGNSELHDVITLGGEGSLCCHSGISHLTSQ